MIGADGVFLKEEFDKASGIFNPQQLSLYNEIIKLLSENIVKKLRGVDYYLRTILVTLKYYQEVQMV